MWQSPTKKPTLIYENCVVRDRHGDVIFHCNSKKANWYVDKGLAVVLNKEPLEIQLTFETKGSGNKGLPFYLQPMRNLCVVCGSTEHLTKHHVVPRSYRRYLPSDIKDHDHHDILVLCIECHESYEQHADVFKKQIGIEYEVPVHGVFVDDESNYEIHKVRGNAMALLRHKDKIPEERQEILMQRIKAFFNTDEIDLMEAANIPIKPPITLQSQGELVVSKLVDVEAFLQRWRDHFVETMKPKFLPEDW